jgi:hypothetical protein
MEARSGEECAAAALVVDFWVEGDRVNPRILEGRPEQGCQIRCWGRNLEDELSPDPSDTS